MLAVGVVTAGFLLGSTHDNTSIARVIFNEWIEWAVGGNSLLSNFFASFTGVFMYFAALTEVPIIQGLLASGMGKGPALALLLAKPVAVATEYVGYSRCYGDKENHCLCSFGYHHGNNIGFCIRKFLLSFPFILLNRHEQKLLLVSVLCIQIIALYLYSERVI
ncbi:permease [Phocaeicola dorei]|nr:permease [Phocaeicola dorei]WHX13540.1 permease [Phocaeicola dorei]